MEWVLVMILLSNYPTAVDTVYRGGYASETECVEVKKVLVDRFKLNGSQAACIPFDGESK